MWSPGTPMVRFTKVCEISTGYRNTMMSPCFGSEYGRMNLLNFPDGAYASLSTSRWSPINKVSSIDPVGITKACTSVVVPKSSSRIVMVHSAMVPRGTSDDVGDVAGAGSTSAVLLRSAVDFIEAIPSVYQQQAGEAGRPLRARYT